MTEEDVPFLPRGVRLHRCKVRDGWFLLAPERAVKMDGPGVAILEALNGERSLGDVVDILAAKFEAPRARIGGDVTRFLTDLQNRRMVETRR